MLVQQLRFSGVLRAFSESNPYFTQKVKGKHVTCFPFLFSHQSRVDMSTCNLVLNVLDEIISSTVYFR